MTLPSRLHLALAAGVILSACGGSPDSGATALRVVTLGGSVTETVAELGYTSSLVGRDDSSTWPVSVMEVPSVGYWRALGAEGVLSLAPDLVIAAEGAGPPDVLAQLESAGIRVVSIPSSESREGVSAKIRTVAGALGDPEAGEELAATTEAAFAEADRARDARAGSTPSAVFLWGQGTGTIMVAGSGTGAHVMLEMAGLENAAGGVDGYTPMSAEAILVAQPDVVVIDGATLERLGGTEALGGIPGLADTPALLDGRVVTVDVLPFVGFGPRSPHLLGELIRQAHPAPASQ